MQESMVELEYKHRKRRGIVKRGRKDEHTKPAASLNYCTNKEEKLTLDPYPLFVSILEIN